MARPQLSRPTIIILAFVAMNLVWRSLFLPVSQSAYTDGVLQIEAFRFGMSYWPPLYALAARLFAWIPGMGLEGSARLISILAATWAVVPLAAIARRLFGFSAAIWTMAVWTASPVALRWGLAVMTDSLATSLWITSLGALVIAVESLMPGLFPKSDGVTPEARPARCNQFLLMASLAGTLATLTRYQGVLLLLPLALAVWKISTVAKHMPNRPYSPWLTLLPWAAAPLWMLRQGPAPLLAHFGQFSDRAGSLGLGSALLRYWYYIEGFLMASPYFLTWGVFGFLIFGLLRTNWATVRLRWAAWTALYFAVAVIVLQACFQSFQFRYMLPLVPLTCIFAGHGLEVWKKRCDGSHVRFWSLAGPALLFSFVISIFVAANQGEPFLDIKQASRYVAETGVPDSARIFSNEFYNEEMIAPYKVRFWTGDDKAKTLQGNSQMQPGDIIMISSFYEGSWENYKRKLELISEALPVSVDKQFSYTSRPLFPDLMNTAMLHGNPSGFDHRYQRQMFQTTVLVMGEAPAQDDPRTELLHQLGDAIGKQREIQKTLQEIQGPNGGEAPAGGQ